MPGSHEARHAIEGLAKVIAIPSFRFAAVDGDAHSERLMSWYFEEHLRFPFLDKDLERQAVAGLRQYGEALFGQVLGGDAAHDYRSLKERGFDGCRVEVTGSAAFHRLHWETLWPPGAPNPLAYRTTIARRVPTRNAPKIPLPTAPNIRVLVIVARPGGADDVGYRTISRPLVETLHQARLAVELDFVRPGTWAALRNHLGSKPQGHYHALHFDGHGSVMSRAELRGGGAAVLYYQLGIVAQEQRQ